MRSLLLGALLFCAPHALIGCGGGSSSGSSGGSNSDIRELLRIPEHMAVPAIPEFNPPTAEKIELGRRLFYDTRLSANGTQSCASCHEQSLAFTDGLVRSIGSTGQVHPRNAQALGNAMYHATLTWANDGFIWLEDQIEVPLLSDNPIELGVTDSIRDSVLSRFASDQQYQTLFMNAFDGSAEVTLSKIIFSLASFCRSLISGRSAYDRFVQGDDSALTEQQKRGLALFNGERFECFHCHSGINFSVSYRDSSNSQDDFVRPFFNNGLYNVGGNGNYPRIDQGIYDLTLNLADRGRFRPQSLRNVELTAPYMHDGSIASLREVIEHYSRGGRLIASGPNAGDGRLNPLKSGLVRGFQATDDEIDAVVAFLHSLTDWEFVSDPRHSNPFEQQ